MHEFIEPILYILGSAGGGFLGGYYLRDLAVASTIKEMEKELKERKIYDKKLYERLKLYLEDMDKILTSRYNKLMVFSKNPAKQFKSTIEKIIEAHY